MRILPTLPALLTLGGLIAGCPVQTVWGVDPASGGGGGAGNMCAGECVPLGPYEPGWAAPALLWMGKRAEVPECPESAPVAEDVGFADLNVSNPCSTCECDRPTGACTLPTSLTAYNTTTYPAPIGAVATSFYAPADWNGSCTTVNAIPAGKQCKGTECVHSITIAPLTLTESGCVSSTVLVFTDDVETWGSMGRVCRGHADGVCADHGTVCTA